MTQKLIAVAAAYHPRWGAGLHALSGVGSALIAIGSGFMSLSYGMIALGCESLVGSVREFGSRLQ